MTSSQTSLYSLWSTEKQRALVENYLIGYNETVIGELSAFEKELIHEETSFPLELITPFEVGNFDANNEEYCKIHFFPTITQWEVLERQYMRLMLVAYRSDECSLPLTVKMTSGSSEISLLAYEDVNILRSHIFPFEVISFPITLTFNSKCTLRVVLTIDQWGTISVVYTWLPLVIYSAITISATAVLLYVEWIKKKEHTILRYAVPLFVLVGYVLSVVVLSLQISLWKTRRIRFPFPPSVTLFGALSIAYGGLWVFLCTVCAPTSKKLVALGALRVLSFCMVSASGVAFFFAGYTFLGVITSCQILIGNGFLCFHCSRVTQKISQWQYVLPSILSSSTEWSFVWCPFSALFAPIFLLFVDVVKVSWNRQTKYYCFAEFLLFRFYFLQSSAFVFVIHGAINLGVLVAASFFHPSFSVFLVFSCFLHIPLLFFLQQTMSETFDDSYRTNTYSMLSFFMHSDVFCTVLPTPSPQRRRDEDGSNEWCGDKEQDGTTRRGADAMDMMDNINTGFPSPQYWPTSVERDDI